MTESQRLQAGKRAPQFHATDLSGREHNLANLRGKRVWLAFFRYAGCPLCNLRIREMVETPELVDNDNLQILAVFQSPAPSLKKLAARHQPSFPLIADPDQNLYRIFGLEAGLSGYITPAVLKRMARATAKGFLPGRMEGAKTRYPADFLIDENGVISQTYYGRDISDHIPVERVVAFSHPA